MHKGSGIFSDRYLSFLSVITAIYVVWWVIYGYLSYTSYYNGFFDIGIETYSLYWHLHGVFALGPFQYLAFANHLSPFEVLLLPIFALFQHPITLLILQALAIGSVSIVIYMACRNIFKKPKWGLWFGIAWLLNPGVQGLLVFDWHPEAFFPLFFILSFYFYVQRRRNYFLLSYALLLSIVELAPFLGASLLVALIIYEFLYNSKKGGDEHARYVAGLRLIAYGAMVTVAAWLAYQVVGSYLLSAYPTVPYSSLPPIIYYGNYTAAQINLLLHPTNYYYDGLALYDGALIGIIILFFWLGFSSLRNLPISLILCSPWLVAVFVLHYTIVTDYYFQYYGYALGGSVVAAMLGLSIISRNDAAGSIAKKLSQYMNPDRIFPYYLMLLLALSIELWSPIVSSIMVVATLHGSNVSAIDGAIDSIPQNASVMAGQNIAAHLFYFRNLELIPIPTNYFPAIGNNTDNLLAPHNTKVSWFKPQYLIVDMQLDGYALNSSSFNVGQFVARNYTETYNVSGVEVFRLNNQSA